MQITDQEIDAVFETVPGGPSGFLVDYGYRQFARALLEYAADNPLGNVLDDVAEERQRQDAKWGGPEHDDTHSTADFAQLIQDYAAWARVMAGMNSADKARRRLVQAAALAVAAVESLDRNVASDGFEWASTGSGSLNR